MILFVLLLSAGFYVFVLDLVQDFVAADIGKDMRWNAHAVYNICNRSLEELLHGGKISDEIAVRIRKVRTLGELENYGRQYDVGIAVFVGDSEEPILTHNTPRIPPGDIEALQTDPQVLIRRVDGEKFYIYKFEFDPWGWNFLLSRNASFYASLEEAIVRSHAVMGVLLLFSILIVVLINRGVKAPINQIVGRLKEGKLPDYKGIEEFQFLSGTISEMMSAIQEKNAWIESLISTVGAMIVVTDARGRIVLSNQKWEQTFGRTREEARGRLLWDLFPDGALGGFVRRYLEDPRNHGDRTTFESTVRLGDGGELTVLWNNSAILDRCGAVKWFIGTGIDISARKQAEQDRRRLELRLRQSQKMEAVGTLAGGVAHEFNNMLQAISGHVQLLLMKKGSEDPERDSLVAIDRTADRAAEMVRRLLMFSRKAKANRVVVDIHEMLRRTVRLLDRTLPETIRLETAFADDPPLILADQFQMEQVLVSLAHNAVEAMSPREGTLTLSTRRVHLGEDARGDFPELAPGDHLVLEVSDTGRGMDPETARHIFDPFFTTKEVGKGTGLGLSIVYGIISEMGGRIACASTPGGGTTFTIHIPLHAGEVSPAAPGGDLGPDMEVGHRSRTAG